MLVNVSKTTVSPTLTEVQFFSNRDIEEAEEDGQPSKSKFLFPVY